MLLNLHGELAEQPSSSTTQKGMNSLHAQWGNIYRQNNPGSAPCPAWGMRTANMKTGEFIKS